MLKGMKRSVIAALTAAAVCSSCSSVKSGSSGSSEPVTAVVTAEATSAEEDTSSAAATTAASGDVSPAEPASENPERPESEAADTPGETPVAEEPAAASAASSVLDLSVFSGLGVSVSAEGNTIRQTREGWELTIVLDKWNRKTSPAQIAECSKLFWECYPRMYSRYGDISNAPTSVSISFDDEDYSPAYADGNHIHVHDQWLRDNPTDYDCLTHELAHVIQNGWDGDRCEYSSYIERFADFCRYEYAYQNGWYNDSVWTLWTPEYESSRETSNRFLVWLDYTYSTRANDVMRKFFKVCFDGNYSPENWDAAWSEIFAGTELAGSTIDEVWEKFAASDFAYLSSDGSHGSSELLSKYDVRSKAVSLC